MKLFKFVLLLALLPMATYAQTYPCTISGKIQNYASQPQLTLLPPRIVDPESQKITLSSLIVPEKQAVTYTFGTRLKYKNFLEIGIKGEGAGGCVAKVRLVARAKTNADECDYYAVEKYDDTQCPFKIHVGGVKGSTLIDIRNQ